MPPIRISGLYLSDDTIHTSSSHSWLWTRHTEYNSDSSHPRLPTSYTVSISIAREPLEYRIRNLSTSSKVRWYAWQLQYCAIHFERDMLVFITTLQTSNLTPLEVRYPQLASILFDPMANVLSKIFYPDRRTPGRLCPSRHKNWCWWIYVRRLPNWCRKSIKYWRNGEKVLTTIMTKFTPNFSVSFPEGIHAELPHENWHRTIAPRPAIIRQIFRKRLRPPICRLTTARQHLRMPCGCSTRFHLV